MGNDTQEWEINPRAATPLATLHILRGHYACSQKRKAGSDKPELGLTHPHRELRRGGAWGAVVSAHRPGRSWPSVVWARLARPAAKKLLRIPAHPGYSFSSFRPECEALPPTFAHSVYHNSVDQPRRLSDLWHAIRQSRRLSCLICGTRRWRRRRHSSAGEGASYSSLALPTHGGGHRDLD